MIHLAKSRPKPQAELSYHPAGAPQLGQSEKVGEGLRASLPMVPTARRLRTHWLAPIYFPDWFPSCMLPAIRPARPCLSWWSRVILWFATHVPKTSGAGFSLTAICPGAFPPCHQWSGLQKLSPLNLHYKWVMGWTSPHPAHSKYVQSKSL